MRLAPGCQLMYECDEGTVGDRKNVMTVGQCMSFCWAYTVENPHAPCKFYTFGTGPPFGSTNPIGQCTLYEDCNDKKECPDCASGSLADCAGG